MIISVLRTDRSCSLAAALSSLWLPRAHVWLPRPALLSQVAGFTEAIKPEIHTTNQIAQSGRYECPEPPEMQLYSP